MPIAKRVPDEAGAMAIGQRTRGRRSGSAKMDVCIDRLLAHPHATKIG